MRLVLPSTQTILDSYTAAGLIQHSVPPDLVFPKRTGNMHVTSNSTQIIGRIVIPQCDEFFHSMKDTKPSPTSTLIVIFFEACVIYLSNLRSSVHHRICLNCSACLDKKMVVTTPDASRIALSKVFPIHMYGYMDNQVSSLAVPRTSHCTRFVSPLHIELLCSFFSIRLDWTRLHQPTARGEYAYPSGIA